MKNQNTILPVSFFNKYVPAFLWVAALMLLSCGTAKKTTRSSHGFTNATKEKYARLLHVSKEDIRNKKLYGFIDEWMEVPYRYGGSTKAGVDCSGFTLQLYQKVYGKSLPRISAAQYEICKRVKKRKKLSEGDLVFFATTGDKKKISHVGVYLINHYFVHAGSRGVVIESLETYYWDKHYISGGRLKN